jgi:hypothetical protein
MELVSSVYSTGRVDNLLGCECYFVCDSGASFLCVHYRQRAQSVGMGRLFVCVTVDHRQWHSLLGWECPCVCTCVTVELVSSVYTTDSVHSVLGWECFYVCVAMDKYSESTCTSHP